MGDGAGGGGGGDADEACDGGVGEDGGCCFGRDFLPSPLAIITIDVAAGERHAADAGKGGATTTTREPCSATTVGAMSSATTEVKMQEGRRIDR